ncbi:MAG: glycosyltransferase family A protein, partial [Bacillota bacterium]|nr:glycosyltransferase family A protein [Bacillota bacterium]
MTLTSVVILTKNAGPEFSTILEMVRKQKVQSQVEIIVIDSGSSDHTLTISRKFKARILQIQPAEFSHGGTRNLGIRLAKGEFVVLLVQDAIPFNNHWLQALLDNLKNDQKVAGVYSRQIPRPDCNIFTKHALENF